MPAGVMSYRLSPPAASQSRRVHIVDKEHLYSRDHIHGIRPAPMGNISSMARAWVASLRKPSDAKRP